MARGGLDFAAGAGGEEEGDQAQGGGDGGHPAPTVVAPDAALRFLSVDGTFAGLGLVLKSGRHLKNLAGHYRRDCAEGCKKMGGGVPEYSTHGLCGGSLLP